MNRQKATLEAAVPHKRRADRTFYLLAGISMLLVLLIAADGVRKHLDTVLPDYYRHKASLVITISELAHGTSGFVGLVEVQQAMERLGFGVYPDNDRMIFLNAHPEQVDAILRSAVDLAISDRGKTFGLMSNETGMIDYYYLAFKLFGYHVRSIYVLYIGILALVALCFICSFRRRAIFIFPSILYLLLLLAEQHGLRATELGFGPLTNSRLLPFLSLYPVLYCLTLIASGRGFRLTDATGVAIAGLVFAFVVNARTYAYWQAGPLLALVLLIVTARILPWRLPLRGRLVRLSVYPVLVFVLCAGGLIGIHHWRRDATVYSTATFAGHEYWLAYVNSTMSSFRWRIPELQRQSGMTIEEADGYAGALLRIKIKERGERLDDYLVDGWWNESKRDALARQVVFDLWRNYPVEMIENYLKAFAPVGINLLMDLGLLVLAVGAISIGPQTLLIWLLRAAALLAIGGISGVTALAAVGLRYAFPAAWRLSTMVVPVSLLALWVIPTIIVMPFDHTRMASINQLSDPRMADLDYAVWLCLLICACSARLSLPPGLRLWQNVARKKTRSAGPSRVTPALFLLLPRASDSQPAFSHQCLARPSNDRSARPRLRTRSATSGSTSASCSSRR